MNLLQHIKQLEVRIQELEKKQVSSMRLEGLILKEVASPATPATGSSIVYVKADGKLYYKDDAGEERLLSYTT